MHLWLGRKALTVMQAKLCNCRRAEQSCTLLTLLAFFKSAPAARSFSTTAVCPLELAMWRGVSPYCSRHTREMQTIDGICSHLLPLISMHPSVMHWNACIVCTTYRLLELSRHGMSSVFKQESSRHLPHAGRHARDAQLPSTKRYD